MKKLTTLFLAFSMVFFLSSCGSGDNNAEADASQEDPVAEMDSTASPDNQAAMSYQLDTANSVMTWLSAKKLVDWKHNGTVGISEGSLALQGSNITAGSFTIDMNTIGVSNIENPDKLTDFLGHMASDDFFSVATFPTASIVITGSQMVEGDSSSTYNVTGDLTIKGITNPITFPVQLTLLTDVVKAKANFVIDRSKWEIKYDSESFFENLGDKVIKDEIEIGLDLVFTLQAA